MYINTDSNCSWTTDPDLVLSYSPGQKSPWSPVAAQAPQISRAPEAALPLGINMISSGGPDHRPPPGLAFDGNTGTDINTDPGCRGPWTQTCPLVAARTSRGLGWSHRHSHQPVLHCLPVFSFASLHSTWTTLLISPNISPLFAHGRDTRCMAPKAGL